MYLFLPVFIQFTLTNEMSFGVKSIKCVSHWHLSLHFDINSRFNNVSSVPSYFFFIRKNIYLKTTKVWIEELWYFFPLLILLPKNKVNHSYRYNVFSLLIYKLKNLLTKQNIDVTYNFNDLKSELFPFETIAVEEVYICIWRSALRPFKQVS